MLAFNVKTMLFYIQRLHNVPMNIMDLKYQLEVKSNFLFITPLL